MPTFEQRRLPFESHRIIRRGVLVGTIPQADQRWIDFAFGLFQSGVMLQDAVFAAARHAYLDPSNTDPMMHSEGTILKEWGWTGTSPFARIRYHDKPAFPG